jgi:hypothetical protein
MKDQEEKYTHNIGMGRVIRWLLILVALVGIGIFFKPINIFINKAQTNARVIYITEWGDINSAGGYHQGYRNSNYNKVYKVTYGYEVNGKYYEGTRKMKLRLSLDPGTIMNSKQPINASDCAEIPIIYCQHWPGWHEVKNGVVEWK